MPFPSTGSHHNGEVNLLEEHGWHMGVQSHEYGHHVHNVESPTGLGARPLYEGWATFYSVAMEERNFHRGLPSNGTGPNWPEPHNGTGGGPGSPSGPYIDIGAYFWDIEDNGQDQLPRCHNTIETMNAREMADVFSFLNNGLTDVGGPGVTFYNEWLIEQGTAPDAEMFRVISFNHYVSTVAPQACE